MGAGSGPDRAEEAYLSAAGVAAVIAGGADYAVTAAAGTYLTRREAVEG